MTVAGRLLSVVAMTAVYLLLPLRVSGAPTSRPADKTSGHREPIPDAKALVDARQKVRAAFDPELKSPDVAVRAATVAKMLAQARDQSNSITLRFALLQAANAEAEKAGDIASSLDALDEIIGRFQVDALQLRLESAGRFDRKRTDPAALAALYLDITDTACEGEDAALASHALAAAEPLCLQVKDPATRDPLKARCASSRRAIRETERLRPFRERLKENADDAQANQELGWYTAVRLERWESGLSLLAKSADPELKTLAQDDLSNAQDLPTILSIAKRWRARSEAKKESDVDRPALQRRAATWYAKARPYAKGLDKVEVDNWLKATVTPAPPTDPARPLPLARLAAARAQYATQLDAIRDRVLASLVEVERTLAASKTSQDKDRLLASAREAARALTERGEFPEPIPDAAQRQLDLARQALRVAYTGALKQLAADTTGRYTRSIEEVQKEFSEFELEPAGLHERMAKMPAPRAEGPWTSDKGALLLPIGTKGSHSIEFGSPDWTDYDVRATVRLDPAVRDEFALAARAGADNSKWLFIVGGFGNLSNRDLLAFTKGEDGWHSKSRRWQGGAQPLEPGQEYVVELRVRGEVAQGFSAGKEFSPSSNAALKAGRAGFSSYQGTRFLDVEVRDPAGHLLWKGLPQITGAVPPRTR